MRNGVAEAPLPLGEELPVQRYTVRKFVVQPFTGQAEEWYADRLGQTGWHIIQIERMADGRIYFWAERPGDADITASDKHEVPVLYLGMPPRGRLTPEQAREIYRIGNKESAESVGRKFGVSASMVWAIRRGRAWASVTGAGKALELVGTQ